MTLSLFSSSKVLLIAIFVAHNLTIRACVLCGVSRVQLPRIVSDLGKTANYELMLTQIGKSTQSYPLQMQPLFSTQKERKQFAVELLLSTDEESTSEDGPLTEDDEQLKLKEVMMGMIRWYRNTLSPIMPPNCRFLPSCSNYALQAIDEQGPYRFF